MSGLVELAERCEAATGPDRELDCRIAKAVGRVPRDAAYEGTYKIGDMAWRGALGYSIPAYTASLDAAMTLVPEGYDWAVFRTNGGLTVHAWCGSREDVFGDTPALALCAAALRARASADQQTAPLDGESSRG